MPPQASQSNSIPAPPSGYQLDQAIPAPPAGYSLDSTPETAQQPPKEGFLHSLGSVFGLTREQAIAANQEAGEHPWKAISKAINAPEEAVKGMVENAVTHGPELMKKAAREASDANTAFSRRDVPGYFAHQIGGMGYLGAAAASPLLGNSPAKAGEQFGEGNVAGGLGTTTGLTLPFLLGAPKETAKSTLLLGKTPEAAYESALKPSTTLGQEARTKLAQTGIKEGIPVSQKGLEKLGSLIDDVNNQIRGTIQADPQRPISTTPAVQNLQGVRQRFATQVNPRSDIEAINQAGKEFQDIYSNQMPAEQAQAVKQGTYRALGDKAYGELKGASIESQKALARGLKDELANQFPELKELNARDSRLLDLQDSLERAVGRIGNHQLIGIGTPVAAGAVKAISGSGKLGAVAGVMKAVLDNPAVKSRLAIALAGKGQPGFLQGAKIAAYSGALQNAANPPLSFLPGSPGYPYQSQDQSAK